MDVSLMGDSGKGDKGTGSRFDSTRIKISEGYLMNISHVVPKDGRSVEGRAGRLTVAMTSPTPNGPNLGQRRQITTLLNSPLGSHPEQN